MPPKRASGAAAANDDYFDEIFKIILIGDTCVGKTNLLSFDPKNQTSPEQFLDRHKATVGVEFASRTFVGSDGTRIKAQLWDTAGQERYRAITTSHYRRAAGAMLVYDVTNPRSLHNIEHVWLPELLKSTEDKDLMLKCVTLVGNKVDLPADVDVEQHVAAATNMGITLSERTSAKTGEDVEKAFAELIARVYSLRKGKGAAKKASKLAKRKAKSAGSSTCC